MSEKQQKNLDKNPEIGAMIMMDHVNFQTPNHDMATLFFIGGLGLTRDPYRRADLQNMGINVGLQQFHLPRRERVAGEGTPPFQGLIGIVHPDIDGARERLATLEEMGALANSPYQWETVPDGALITSPFGYQLQLHTPGSLDFEKVLGIAYVEVYVPTGSSPRIGAFYEKIVGAPVRLNGQGSEPSAIVYSGPHQELRFVERDLEDYQTHNMHVSYHVTHYNQLRRELREHDAILGDGQGEVFFFDKIYDPENGETIFQMQNEVRSVYHPDFMRPLINRWPLETEPFSDQTQVMKKLAKQLGFMPGTV